MRITVYYQGTLLARGDSAVGSVVVPLDGHGGWPDGRWFPLESTRGEGSSCSVTLKLAVGVWDKFVLTQDQYEPLWDLVRDQFAATSICMNNVTGNCDELFEPLYAACTHYGGEATVLSCFADLARAEVQSTADFRTLFRQSTFALRMLERLMRHVGRGYLQNSVGPIIKLIIQEDQLCEVEPGRLRQGDDIEMQRARLLRHVKSIWGATSKSINLCPKLLRHLFTHVSAAANEKFPDANAGIRAVSYVEIDDIEDVVDDVDVDDVDDVVVDDEECH